MILNERFIYLINLEYLSLKSNQIEFIDLNSFKGLNELLYLNLTNNRLKTIELNLNNLIPILIPICKKKK